VERDALRQTEASERTDGRYRAVSRANGSARRGQSGETGVEKARCESRGGGQVHTGTC
jgi:hypothetical protein